MFLSGAGSGVADGKSIVIGVVRRKGKIIAEVAPDVRATTLIPFIESKVMPRSTVFTDEMWSYSGLERVGYRHKRVHHAAKVYVSVMLIPTPSKASGALSSAVSAASTM